jgi:restriction system protein
VSKNTSTVVGRCLLAIIVIAILYGLLSGHLGEAIVAILLGLMIVGMVISGIERLAKFNATRALCPHGVRGAVEDLGRCPQCLALQQRAEELKQQFADRQRRLEEEQRRRENQTRITEWKEQLRTPQYLKSMDPRLFEELCGLLFEKLGYSADVTRYVADGGVDAFLRKDGNLTLLQCKRVQGSVGQPVLRDLFGSMRHNEAMDGIVVTTGSVSASARQWVSGKPIRIIELAELVELLERHISKDAVVPKSFTASVSKEAVTKELRICPRCGRSLKERTGRHGKFLGCTGYPECTYSFSRRWKNRR